MDIKSRVIDVNAVHICDVDYYEEIRTIKRNKTGLIWKRNRLTEEFFRGYCTYCIERFYKVNIKEIDIYKLKELINEIDFYTIFNLNKGSLLDILSIYVNHMYISERYTLDDLLTFIYCYKMDYSRWLKMNFKKFLEKKETKKDHFIVQGFNTLYNLSSHLLNEKNFYTYDKVAYMFFEMIAEIENIDINEDEEIRKLFKSDDIFRKYSLNRLVYFFDSKHHLMFKLFNINKPKETFENHVKGKSIRVKRGIIYKDFYTFIDALYSLKESKEEILHNITLKHELTEVHEFILFNFKEFKNVNIENYYNILSICKRFEELQYCKTIEELEEELEKLEELEELDTINRNNILFKSNLLNYNNLINIISEVNRILAEKDENALKKGVKRTDLIFC